MRWCSASNASFAWLLGPCVGAGSVGVRDYDIFGWSHSKLLFVWVGGPSMKSKEENVDRVLLVFEAYFLDGNGGWGWGWGNSLHELWKSRRLPLIIHVSCAL